MKQITELYSNCHIVGDFEVVIPALRHVSVSINRIRILNRGEIKWVN